MKLFRNLPRHCLILSKLSFLLGKWSTKRLDKHHLLTQFPQSPTLLNARSATERLIWKLCLDASWIFGIQEKLGYTFTQRYQHFHKRKETSRWILVVVERKRNDGIIIRKKMLQKTVSLEFARVRFLLSLTI